MPGIKYYNDIVRPNIQDLFGFFYCEIERKDKDYLGILPYRSKDGLIFPLGKWEGWYFSKELKLAQNYGYKIKIIKGYKFSKQKNVFTKYVEFLYKIKYTTKITYLKLYLNY